MPSPLDPTRLDGTANHGEHPLARALREARRAIWIAGAATLFMSAWALWPLGDTGIDIPAEPLQPQRMAMVPDIAPIDLAAFSAPTWSAPPLPPKPVIVAAATPPPPPPPPLKLQLLGIVRDDPASAGGTPTYIAAIYDEAADKLLMLKAGDVVGAGGRISRVHADAVELTEPSGPRRLALRQPVAPIPGFLLDSRQKGGS